GAVVSYTLPTATDLVDGTDSVQTDHPSGSTFALGTTLVTLTSTDASGNTSTETFNITVADTTPPSFQAPADITAEAAGRKGAEATGPQGAVVSYTLPTATDLVDGTDTVLTDHPSGSTFALGTTLVTLTSTDASGNTSTETFNVTVLDTTPPSFQAPADITVEATGPLDPRVGYT